MIAARRLAVALPRPDERPRPQARARGGASWRPLVLALAATAAAALLPFVVLVRAGAFFHVRCGLGTWPALLLSAATTTLILSAYGWAASRRFHWRPVKISAAAVAAFCLYALFCVAPSRVKDANVRLRYGGVHPLLRLGTAVVALFDGQVLVTDGSRVRADYAEMGLPAEERSLHFRRANGYAYAMDIRTAGRGFLRNATTAALFRFLGFRVLRHVGTADHLHVSLPGAP
jgi:hypothetical protein